MKDNYPQARGRILRRIMPLDEIGWCHHCGTLQRFADAPWLPVPSIYGDVQRVPCCVVCRENEPWEMGVFPMPATLDACARARHVTWGPDDCDECGRRAPGRA